MQNIVINPAVKVVNTLPKVMKLNHKTTIQLGRELGYTQSYVSKLKHGNARLQFDAVQSLLKTLPLGKESLALDIANQLTGGIVPPVANGDGIKGDVEAFGNRSIREMSHAIDALAKSEDEFETPANAVHNHSDPENAVYETMDAVFIAINAEINVCHEYGFDMQEMAAKRAKIWKQHKLMK